MNCGLLSMACFFRTPSQRATRDQRRNEIENCHRSAARRAIGKSCSCASAEFSEPRTWEDIARGCVDLEAPQSYQLWPDAKSGTADCRTVRSTACCRQLRGAQSRASQRPLSASAALAASRSAAEPVRLRGHRRQSFLGKWTRRAPPRGDSGSGGQTGI
jgi:hypothetical protein